MSSNVKCRQITNVIEFKMSPNVKCYQMSNIKCEVRRPYLSLDCLIVGLLVCYKQTTLRCSIFVGFLLVHLAIFLLSQIIESEPSGWGEPPPVVDQNTLDLVSAVQRGALERWNLEEKAHVQYHFFTTG